WSRKEPRSPTLGAPRRLAASASTAAAKLSLENAWSLDRVKPPPANQVRENWDKMFARELDPHNGGGKRAACGRIMLRCEGVAAISARWPRLGRRTGTCPAAHRRTRRLGGGRTRTPDPHRSTRDLGAGLMLRENPGRKHPGKDYVICPSIARDADRAVH